MTRVVQGISQFLTSWWWALLVLAAGLAAGVSMVLRTDNGHRFFDRLILRLPLVGELVRMENTSRMAVVLSALLRSGLQFVEAVRITRETLRNRLFRGALEECEQAVMAGRDLAGPLEASGVFSPMVVQIVAVGQRAGQLEDMLQQLSESYDQQIATATQRLTAVLEPLLIVLLALMVGFVVFATILPILEVSNVL